MLVTGKGVRQGLDDRGREEKCSFKCSRSRTTFCLSLHIMQKQKFLIFNTTK